MRPSVSALRRAAGGVVLAVLVTGLPGAPADAAVVPASVSGRVVDAGGAGIAGVEVRLIRTTGLADIVQTGPGGGYAFSGVAAGSYQVSFTDRSGDYAEESYPDRPDLTSGALVPVAAGQAVVLAAEELAQLPATTPVGVDVTGVVTGRHGRPVSGVQVSAYGDAVGPGDPLDSDVTDRAGRYDLTELDPAATGTAATAFRLEFTDSGAGTTRALAHLPGRSGDATTMTTATPVTVPAGGTTTYDEVLAVSGGISGTVAAPTGGAAFISWVDVYDGDARRVAGTVVRPDGSYFLSGLPTGDYRVRFGGYAESGATAERSSVVPTWFSSGNDFASARTVAVRAGAFTRGVDTALGDLLVPRRAPSVRGDARVGGTLRADPGRWGPADGTTFAYEWLAAGRVRVTGPTYVVGPGLAGRSLRLRVTTTQGDRVGIDATSPVRVAPGPRTPATGEGATRDVTRRMQVRAAVGKARRIVRAGDLARLSVGQ